MVILPGHFICEKEFEGWFSRMTFEKCSSHFLTWQLREKKDLRAVPTEINSLLSSGLWGFGEPRENTDFGSA